MQRSVHLSAPAGRIVTVCALLILLLAAVGPVSAQAPIRIIFLHHSCGQNLIDQGGVREGLTALGYEFYDHGYNDDGLRLADGTYTGTNFNVPDDNTDPDGFAAIFAQPLHDPPDNTFSYLMQYDVILFKSCFPVSNIGDDAQLADYQSYYLSIRDRMDQYPDKLFIIVTQPPQVPANSNPQEAARARAFTQWLQSDEYLAGHPNVTVFDFFGLLAGDDNFLRREYRGDEYDAHPNEQANQIIGPQFVAFIDQAIRAYWGEEGLPPARPTPAEEEVSPPVSAAGTGLIEDFETLVEPLEPNSDSPASVIECGADNTAAHGGSASLRIHYAVTAGGWATCGYTYRTPQNWGDSDGIFLWFYSDEGQHEITFGVGSGGPDAATPFEVYFDTPPESAGGWAQVFFAWEDFIKPDWAGEEGLSEIDPSQVTGYWFGFGAGEERREGILWVDDMSLGMGEMPPAPPAEEETEAPQAAEEEETTQPRGRLCPGAAAVLPLGLAGVAAAFWRRRH